MYSRQIWEWGGIQEEVGSSGNQCSGVHGTGDSENSKVAESDEQAWEFPEADVCIDAKVLTHLPAADLIFDKHSSALYLCDSSSSCATHGHIGNEEGQPMMTKSYRHFVGGCEEWLMKANSLRWKRQIRVHSKTALLEYTGFAAIFSIRGETWMQGPC